MNLALVLAQESTETGGGLAAFLPLLLAVGFLFLIMLPQRRMRKKQQELQTSLTVGDAVRTAGGIHGRIVEMDDSSVVIDVESGRLRVERRAISGKIEP
jgi:preprotein translocase subunit YajC